MTANTEITGNTSSYDDAGNSLLLPRRKVLYCGPCGMPLEYCEYGPDYESDCLPWLKKNHPEIYESLMVASSKQKQQQRDAAVAKDIESAAAESAKKVKASDIKRPENPRTTEERLKAFYEKYEPTKVDTVPGLLQKYSGKEEKLFEALCKKYGLEPKDPYFSDSDDDDDDDGHDDNDDEGDDNDDDDDDNDDIDGDDNNEDSKKKKKRRGASAKKAGETVPIRVVIIKQTQKKKRCLTVINGMDTVPGLKLKDVSKAFSKKFAGSSSVKDNHTIIVQGDHIVELAEMLIDKFNVPEKAIFLDLDNNGEVVPFH